MKLLTLSVVLVAFAAGAAAPTAASANPVKTFLRVLLKPSVADAPMLPGPGAFGCGVELSCADRDSWYPLVN